ncbi:hypothetical protein GCM10022288_11950 [Gryllotalpicola kribbensis]|uniref:O-antigen ligase domain-containing protein n=1 Tax=Gryllotalpicola kribbensis TaxID=993084 RepID=A0ABP8AP79_9MICO
MTQLAPRPDTQERRPDASTRPAPAPNPHRRPPRRATLAAWWWAVISALAVVGAVAGGLPQTAELVLVVAFGLVLVAVCLVYEEIAWAALVLALSANGIKFQLGGLTMLPEHLAIILAAVHLVLNARATKVRPLSVGKAVLAGAALIVLWWVLSFGISLAAALQPEQSVRLLTWVLANIVAAVLVCLLRTPTVALVRVGVTVATVAAVIDLVGWLASSKAGALSVFTERDYASNQFRLQGLGSEPNVAAAFFVIWLCVAYAASKRIPAPLIWTYLVLSGVCVYLTYTRIAWLMFAFVALGLALRMLRGSRFFLVFAVLGVAVAVALVAYVLSLSSTSGSGAAAFLARLDSLQNLDSGTGALRLSTANVAVADLNTLHGWFSGFGYNAFPQHHDTGVTSYATPYLALLWLALFYDSGFVGAVPFILGYLLLWGGTARARSTWFFLVFALASTTTNIIWFAFPWVAGALLVRLSSKEAQDTQDAPAEESAQSTGAPRAARTALTAR